MFTFESFNKDRYKSYKKELEEDLIQKLGDEFIEEIVADGDFDGLNFLLNTGYDVRECDSANHLAVVALKNNKKDMFEWLLENYADINTISLPDIIGSKDYNDKSKNKFTDKSIEMLKTITKYGYRYYDRGTNLIDLYMTDNRNVDGEWIKVLWKDAEPFVDWLLTNYPSNYRLFKDIYLPEELREKYKDLGEYDKYNL